MNLLPEVPGYELSHLIGEGGMGQVFAAKRTGTDEMVAVKVLMPERTSSAWRKRFEREARAMMSVNHENLCRAIDFGVLNNGQLYLVMEYLVGEDLADVLKRKVRLNDDEVIRIGCEAAAGLAAAHAQNVVHRDIKPSNLFLVDQETGPPRVKVLDFGLAVFGQGDDVEARVTRTGEVVGTPGYMAPEQARGSRTEDARCDVYGLAAVLYRCLCGTPPAGKGSALQVLYRLLTQEPADVCELAPYVSRALGDLIMQALGREPVQRPADMREFANQLRLVEAALDDTVEERLDLTLVQQVIPDLAEETRFVTVMIADGVSDVAALKTLIGRHGGDCIVVTSNRVAGVFGSEVVEGDEAQRACSTALEASEYTNTISIGSGRALGRGGLLAGQAIDSAEALARVSDRGVFVDEATRKNVNQSFQVQGNVLISEKNSSLKIDEDPMFGRTVELGTLVGLAHRAFEDEEPVGHLVVGPPGIGKSRLTSAVIQSVTDDIDDILVLEARADSQRHFSSWWLFAQVLGSALQLSDEAGSEARVAAVQAASQSLGLEPDSEHLLGAILGVPLKAGLSSRLDVARNDGQVLHNLMIQSAGDWVEALVQDTPVLVVVEDVQWGDRASLKILDVVLHRIDEGRLCILMTGRPHALDAHSELLGEASVGRTRLRELPKKASREFVQSLGLNEELARQLSEHAGGNPLFLSELAFVALAGDSEFKTGVLPGSVEGAIQSRLDYLPSIEKDLVKRASVCGMNFSTEALEHMGASEVANSLAGLRRRDIVVTSRKAGGAELELSFKRALVRDVAYRMLTADQQKALHHTFGHWLVQQSIGNAFEVAHHLTQGGQLKSAAPYWSVAAEHAYEEGDLDVAVDYLGSAVAGTEGSQLVLELRLRRLSWATLAMRLELAQEELKELLEASASLSEEQQADFAYWQASICRMRGQWVESSELYKQAIVTYRKLGEQNGLSRALGGLAIAHCYGGLGPAQELAAQAVIAAGSDTLALARAIQCQMAVEVRGLAFNRARELGVIALQKCEEAGDLRRSLEVLVALAYMGSVSGDHENAITQLRDIVTRSQKIGSRNTEAYARHNLGLLLMHREQYKEALVQEQFSLELAQVIGDSRLECYSNIYLAFILVARGQALDAMKAAKNGLELAAGNGCEPPAHTAMAHVYLALGQHEQGLAQTELALSIKTETAVFEELETELMLTRAELFSALGREDEAQTAYKEAREVLERRASEVTQTSEERSRYFNSTSSHRRIMSRI